MKTEPIRLDWGWPSRELLAVESFGEVARTYGRNSELGNALFYGQRTGNDEERLAIADALGALDGVGADSKSFILTSGAGVALDLILGVSTRRTSVCFTQALTYHNALKIIEDRGYRAIALAETAEEQLDLNKVEIQFQKYPGALCYLVPTYSNPCGTSLGENLKRELITLASRYEITIIADEVYRLLSFDGVVAASMASLDPSGDVVVSLGSLTKIAGPGLRLGWMRFGTAAEESKLGSEILDAGLLINGGCLNQFSAWMVGKWLREGHLPEHLAGVRQLLAERAAILYDGLQASSVTKLFTSIRPEGGYFIWLKPRIPKLELVSALKESGVIVRAAPDFRAEEHYGSDGLRLSFSYLDQSNLLDAAGRISDALSHLKV